MELETKKEIIYSKGLVEITEKNFLGEKKSFKFKLSVETPDRSNDIVKVAGIKLGNYMENPVVLFNHQQDLLPIGIGKELEVVGEILFGEVEFHESTQLSKDIATLVEQGVLRAVSIGFLPLTINTYPITPEMRATGNYYPYTNTVRVIEEAELIEFSIVAVPANQEALVTMGFENLVEKVGSVLNKSNYELLTQAYNLIGEVINSVDKPQTPADSPMDPMMNEIKVIDEEVIIVDEIELDIKNYVSDEYLDELLSKIKY
jgi:HK97 family phage prohead protease